ncbi:MAG TPA: bifunctional (p)ppGpp synthetase/guanosine-3',5'-bis(diphosphate) 3'-pyrophosphohydrolase, partial [Anaerolineae bacterium]|nr:bifunctional (p)ppGpp synthetase/guanosine-3',5'-bis(diphosphate) 3'-pyrophosphohydrolase [Anaerolineae bacterium]
MDIGALLEKLPNHLSRDDRELIKRAYELAEVAHQGQRRASGEPYVQHCLAVAQILAELGMDGPTIAAGLLHDTVEDSIISIDDLRHDFGDEVAKLVNGVT